MVVTTIVGGQKGDGQMVNMHVRLPFVQAVEIGTTGPKIEGKGGGLQIADNNVTIRYLMRSAMNMGNQKISLEKRAWLLPPTQTPLSMSASKTYSPQAVRHPPPQPPFSSLLLKPFHSHLLPTCPQKPS